MADKDKMGELFRQDAYDPRPYAEQAGLGDIGRTYYAPVSDFTADQSEAIPENTGRNLGQALQDIPRNIDRNFGRTLRSITQGFNPKAFDAWYDTRPDSPNVEATFNARWGALPSPRKDQGRR